MKSQLKRSFAEPVEIAYRCCGSRQREVTHPLDTHDLGLLYYLETDPPLAEGYFPTTLLPDGVNLCQPKRHGLDRVDRLYTPRNLTAMSHLWRAIHRIQDDDIAGAVAFVFTSLYQRVTRLSEFRFWGGSGNTPRLNVPFVFNEANVFLTFERKARSVQDHLETTARHYSGDVIVLEGSAARLDDLPSGSIDLVFTDPPFGGNINYSEMNLLWESWLGRFTDPTDEAIINRFQQKDLAAYEDLMRRALAECYRVLRDGSWMLLVFMNSSYRVWESLHNAVRSVGFAIQQVDVFDKQHGTFKHHVSENTAGCDLVLHCKKVQASVHNAAQGHAEYRGVSEDAERSAIDFLSRTDLAMYRTSYLHVGREDEADARQLYSRWLSERLIAGKGVLDFARFRALLASVTGEASDRLDG